MSMVFARLPTLIRIAETSQVLTSAVLLFIYGAYVFVMCSQLVLSDGKFVKKKKKNVSEIHERVIQLVACPEFAVPQVALSLSKLQLAIF